MLHVLVQLKMEAGGIFIFFIVKCLGRCALDTPRGRLGLDFSEDFKRVHKNMNYIRQGSRFMLHLAAKGVKKF